MSNKIAINGFGRIGRAAFKVALTNKNLEVVAINDLTDIKTLAYLLQYDSVYGIYHKKIDHDAKHIIVGKKKIPVFAVPEPQKLPWKKNKIEVVLECTGRFVKDGIARDHLKAGAKKVIISAPVKGNGNIKTIVIGVNDKEAQGENVVSCASCTTNCIAPVTKIIDENFGVEKSLMTTIHAYTSTQNLVDLPHKDLRRARAAAVNMIPTTTGAAIAATKTLPQLKGKFDGMAIRVPIACGSIADLTFLTQKETSVEKINRAFKKADRGILKNILVATSEPIVSSDIIMNSASAIVDLACTKVVDGNLVKVIAWYDNEWGYANRLTEMVGLI